MMSTRSSIFRPLDDEPSWVVNCFFVHRDHRGLGLSKELLEAAVAHARRRGARRLDAYPQDTSIKEVSNPDLYVGSLQMFLDAGFSEIARMRDRPVVRLEL